jgi:hypothetical protein
MTSLLYTIMSPRFPYGVWISLIKYLLPLRNVVSMEIVNVLLVCLAVSVDRMLCMFGSRSTGQNAGLLEVAGK